MLVTRGLVSSGGGWWSSWCSWEQAIARRAIAYPVEMARKRGCSIVVNEVW